MVSIPPQVSPHGKRFSAKILTARFERLVLRWSTNGRPGRSLTPSLLGWKKPCRHVGGHCIWEARAMKPRLQNKKNPKVETFSSPETLVPLPKKRRWRELGKKNHKKLQVPFVQLLGGCNGAEARSSCSGFWNSSSGCSFVLTSQVTMWVRKWWPLKIVQ